MNHLKVVLLVLVGTVIVPSHFKAIFKFKLNQVSLNRDQFKLLNVRLLSLFWTLTGLSPIYLHRKLYGYFCSIW